MGKVTNLDGAAELAAGSRREQRLVLPLPSPLYPCAHCYQEYSWPAEDLIWCPEIHKWVCVECWDHEVHGDTKGTTLAEEIERQNTQL